MSKLIKAAYAGLVYVFLYLPLVVIGVYSFNASKYSLAWKGFTLQWYGKLLNNSTLLDAAFRSMTIAVVSATLACVIGTLAAFIAAPVPLQRPPGSLRFPVRHDDVPGHRHRHIAAGALSGCRVDLGVLDAPHGPRHPVRPVRGRHGLFPVQGVRSMPWSRPPATSGPPSTRFSGA